MLSRSTRLRSSRQLQRTVRRGVRVTRPCLVLHGVRKGETPSQVGFVVSKAVGGAVVRNRVKRQLRALVRPLVASQPFGVDVVVRALPAASVAHANLGGELSDAWVTLMRRLGVDAVIGSVSA
jgi:ribonuclease P protein component